MGGRYSRGSYFRLLVLFFTRAHLGTFISKRRPRSSARRGNNPSLRAISSFFLQLLCLFFEIDMMDGYNDRNKSLIPLRFSMSSLLSSYPDFTSSFCVHI